MNRLEGKTAVVTGAGSGIGRAIALRFAQEGARVVIAEIDPETGADAAAEAGAVFVQTDVTDAEAVERMAARVERDEGRIDCLVNNAGTNFFTDPLTAGDDVWERCVELDMKGAWHCVKACVPRMTGGGSIINIASTHPLRTVPSTFPYGAAKGGLIAMTAGWACDFGPRGIRVNVILPGFIVTPLTYETEKDPDASFRRILFSQCVKRLGTPGDCAALAAYLAADESSFLTGAQIILDGGRHVLNAGILPREE